MHWRLQPYYNDEGFDCGLEWSYNIGTFLQEDAYESFLDYIPAWSLHRLIEMGFNSLALLEDADDEDEIFFMAYKNPFESMLEMFEQAIKEGYFNKEYLV